MSVEESLRPVALSRDGAERLLIDWNDGVRSTFTWKSFRGGVSLVLLPRRTGQTA